MNRVANRTSRWMLGAALTAGLALGLPVEAPRATAAPVQDGDSQLERAIQEMEALLGELRRQPNQDAALIRRLDAIVSRLQLAKMEAEAKDAAADADGTPDGDAPSSDIPGEPRPLPDWASRRLYEDVQLPQVHQDTADDLFSRFYTDYAVAREQKDEKSKQVVLQDTKDRIDAYLPKKQAGKLKSNLDGMVRRWDWWGRGR